MVALLGFIPSLVFIAVLYRYTDKLTHCPVVENKEKEKLKLLGELSRLEAIHMGRKPVRRHL